MPELKLNTSKVTKVSLIDGGTPITGIAHRTDYKYEEEVGAGKLTGALRKCAHPDTWMSKECILDGELKRADNQANIVAMSTDEWAIFAPLGADRVSESHLNRAIENAKHNKEWHNGLLERRRDYKFKKVADLRAVAKERGIKPLPTRKADLVEALTATDPAPKAGDLKGSRMYYDMMLLLPRNTGDEYGEVVEKLLDAAEHGTLFAANPAGNPFATSIALFDSRDLSDSDAEAIHKIHADIREDTDN